MDLKKLKNRILKYEMQALSNKNEYGVEATLLYTDNGVSDPASNSINKGIKLPLSLNFNTSSSSG